MNQRAFRRALRYGFGRAILHLRGHDAAPYRGDILDGCLHFWGFDGDFDHNRPDYMFEVISLTGEREFYRDRILAAVESAAGDRDGHQHFALARIFTEAGDEAARVALDRALERLPFDHKLAEHTIMLHGPAGLLRVLRLRLDRLDPKGGTQQDSVDVDPWIIQEATDRWGKRAFASAMQDAGRADPRIRNLWSQLRQEEAKWRQDLGKRSEQPSLTYEQVNEILANPEVGKAFGAGHWSNSLRNWAKTATDDEWRRLAAELSDLPGDDPRWQRAVRYLYNGRAFPGDPHRLIATVQAARLDRFRYLVEMDFTERLALRAMNALAEVTHPAVRSFALEMLKTSRWTSHAASLLAANYEDGDLELLAAVFRRERSEWQRHGIALSIRQIDERLAPAEAPAVLLLLYEHVRCGMCRCGLVERLHAHDALPSLIAEECCFDAYFGLRERIAEIVPGVCGGPGGYGHAGGGNRARTATRPPAPPSDSGLCT